MAHDPHSSEAEVSAVTKNSTEKPEISSVSATSPSTDIRETDNEELILDYGHESQIGIRPKLEDMVLIEPDFMVNSSKCTSSSLALFAVFDGHGGKDCAVYCSNHYSKILSKHLCLWENINEAINKSISELDDLVIKHAKDASGSTATILLIDKLKYDMWVINIGDSRCIKVCETNGNHDIDSVEELSVVHQPDDESEKQRIEDAGAWVTFGRVMGMLAVSRALGDKDFKIHLKGVVISNPSIKHHCANINDKYVLVACDGLFDVYTGEDIQTFIDSRLYDDSEEYTLEQIVQELVHESIRTRRSKDNVTCILVTIQVPSNNNNNNSNNDMSNSITMNNENNHTNENTNSNSNSNNNQNNNNDMSLSESQINQSQTREMSMTNDETLNIQNQDNENENENENENDHSNSNFHSNMTEEKEFELDTQNISQNNSDNNRNENNENEMETEMSTVSQSKDSGSIKDTNETNDTNDTIENSITIGNNSNKIDNIDAKNEDTNRIVHDTSNNSMTNIESNNIIDTGSHLATQ